MKVSYNWLQSYFEKPLPSVDKLVDIFNFHVFEIEGTEKVGSDTVIDVKTLPDRNHYALCHMGIAEEVSVLTDLPLIKKVPEQIKISKVSRDIKITVKDSNFCPRYIARVVENVKVGDSPAWVKERLEAIGARAINSVVDATNYVMFDVGQPLHAFDADKVKGNIVVRPASPGEKITTLDGKDVTLSEEDSVIADDVGPLAIAGVKGGNRAEVDKNTKNIIIEAANFNATAVRKTSVRVNIKNDAVKRYENDRTPASTPIAMNDVTDMIVNSSADCKVGEIFEVYPNPVKQREIKVSISFIKNKLGMDIGETDIVTILKKFNISVEVSKDNKDILNLIIPIHRLDLIIPEDIVEEVGRVYGYDKLPSTPLPKANYAVGVLPEFYWSEKMKDLFGFETDVTNQF